MSVTSQPTQGSSDCTDMCSHAVDYGSGTCYAKPASGGKCEDERGPTRNVCSSDCTACGTFLDSSAPSSSPAPTAEVWGLHVGLTPTSAVGATILKGVVHCMEPLG